MHEGWEINSLPATPILKTWLRKVGDLLSYGHLAAPGKLPRKIIMKERQDQRENLNGQYLQDGQTES